MSTGDFQTKALDGFEIKNVDRGEVVAVVSTLDHVDRDGDVILSGAIPHGSTVKLSAYGHDVITEGRPPVGHGVVNIEGNRAVLNARYFMSTERGRDAFNTVRELGSESEWSIGFSKQVKTSPMTDAWKAKGARRLIAGLVLYEASPVFMGANAQTGTVSAKAAQAAVDAVAEAEQEWLRGIYDAHVVPFELRARIHETAEVLERSDIAQMALRSMDRELTRPDSYMAPAEFEQVVDFARRQIGLDARALPSPRLVRPGSLKAHGKRTRGVFLVAKNLPAIFLEDRSGDVDGMAHTFFHEAAHARQHHYGDPMTEPDACEQAAELFAAWQRREQEG